MKDERREVLKAISLAILLGILTMTILLAIAILPAFI